MAKSVDPFREILSEWDQIEEAKKALVAADRMRALKAQAFSDAWHSVYSNDEGAFPSGTPEQIASKLINLGMSLIEQNWDYHIAHYVAATPRLTRGARIACLLLLHACHDNEREIADRIRLADSRLLEVALAHLNLLASLSEVAARGLPHTPLMNQPELRTVLPYECTEDRLRGEIRTKKWRFPETEAVQHRRHWRHEDDAVQAVVLAEIRRKFANKIRSETMPD